MARCYAKRERTEEGLSYDLSPEFNFEYDTDFHFDLVLEPSLDLDLDEGRIEEAEAGFAKARDAIGQERILVNCAGTGNAFKTAGRDKKTGAINTFPMDKFELIIQINLLGTFRCIALSAAGMMTLGLATTGPAEHLADAQRVIDDLQGVSLEQLQEWYG